MYHGVNHTAHFKNDHIFSTQIMKDNFLFFYLKNDHIFSIQIMKDNFLFLFVYQKYHFMVNRRSIEILHYI